MIIRNGKIFIQYSQGGKSRMAQSAKRIAKNTSFYALRLALCALRSFRLGAAFSRDNLASPIIACLDKVVTFSDNS
jgi:hypothetical protein